MRFSFFIKFFQKTNEVNKEDANISIPSSYRTGISSLFKEALQREDPEFFKEFYGNRNSNKPKPFVFSTYIPNAFGIADNKIKFPADTITVNYSTNNMDFYFKTYNGLLKIKEYPFFDYKVNIKSVRYKKPVYISENKIIFKFMSPMLLRNYDRNNNKYLLPETDKGEYYNQLEYSLKALTKHFIPAAGKYRESQIQFNFIKTRIVPLLHYKAFIKGISGTIEIVAPPEILQMCYDIGIGSRRSEGFGMVEIV